MPLEFYRFGVPWRQRVVEALGVWCKIQCGGQGICIDLIYGLNLSLNLQDGEDGFFGTCYAVAKRL